MPLTDRHCRSFAPGTAALSAQETRTLLLQVPLWELDLEGLGLTRDFSFESYWAEVGFVNAVAWIAQREKHHPDMVLGYKKARISFRTHDAGGLTENDFICAAKVDLLVE
ncbi:MAG: 4a-hydroxytetrahydrobiopterin dehydratase [bacterium]